ncbi:hypothetical protein K450DRAFT_218649 [Umbelopsis ramanniana AG]|uniref:Uncharacterized protein n=1 Tax=Umbelopsis ramanniana AG TaxID=1314678 RepID=A0AAD5EI02_UMBRA|nr:uncharacterized protein K450DRAFT_218649 [Umbelopsis ramanniana AG]KAI8584203.1 hypothetical protein K450DRAFT_218649 [Umbelopsis ramanniana AG]
MPTGDKWLLTLASQETSSEDNATIQSYNVEERSSKFDSKTLSTSQRDWKENPDHGEGSQASPYSDQIPLHDGNDTDIVKNESREIMDEYSQQTVQDAIDTSGCWSIGEFSQDEEDLAPQPSNFREQALFSQIANSRDDIDDNSSYSSILGDISPRLSSDDFDNHNVEFDDLKDEGVSNGHDLKSRSKKLNNLETCVSGSDAELLPKQNVASALSLAAPPTFIPKAPVFISSKSTAFSVLNSSTKSDTSKRKHNQISSDSHEKITLVENGLSMKAKKLLEEDQHAHNQWDTDVRGYMAQLGSVAFLGPIYPNTQLFRIVNIMDDKGLVYTECIRIEEPPEEVVWKHVSAAENNLQDDNQVTWSPAESDDVDTNPQVIYFSFVNSSLSQPMRARFNQSQLVRIWPPWHEYLLEMDDGSVTTIKLVTQFITDAIY